ncbi:MAG: HTTM domain-containing protein [Candidatus Omnitrophota bacterium]
MRLSTRSLLKRLSEPVDIAWLVFFRIAFGALMLWDAYHNLSKNMVLGQYVEPTFYFKYYGFDWVSPWPGNGMIWHFYAWAALAVLMALGLWYRLSALLFFLAFTYVFLLDQSNYLNHNYLICLVSFLMIFLPAHRNFSLDVLRKPRTRIDTVPVWMLWLLQFQIGIVYFYGGIAKLNTDWLLHARPLELWLPKPFPVLSQFMTHEQIAYLFSYGGFFLDLLIVPFLLWNRTRLFAFIASVLFHLANSQLFNIGVFPWFMIAATMLFFSPDWPRQVLKRFGWKSVRREGPPPAVQLNETPRLSLLTSGLLLLYASFQILFPLRHWLYPGNVNWTEEGHRFSWHMKLRGKEIRYAFAVVDPSTRQLWKINPRDYLTSRQAKKAGTRPDMILQFAKHLAKEYEKKGHPGVKVHASVFASLNGRKAQQMIDPEVDLAAQPRNLMPAPWILPLKEPLEP